MDWVNYTQFIRRYAFVSVCFGFWMIGFLKHLLR